MGIDEDMGSDENRGMDMGINKYMVLVS